MHEGVKKSQAILTECIKGKSLNEECVMDACTSSTALYISKMSLVLNAQVAAAVGIPSCCC